MRVLDVATGAALAAARKSGLIKREFVWIVGKTPAGEPVEFGFWNDIEDVTVTVIDAETGQAVSRDFIGGGSIISVPSIPLKVGLDFQSISIALNPLHAAVENMLRANNIRAARIDIYLGIFSVDTHLLVSQPRQKWAGKIDVVKISTPRAGGEAVVTITAMPFSRELTRTNKARKSDEAQKQRSNDRWRRFESKKMQVIWGEYQEAAEPQGKGGWFGLGWGPF